MRELITLVCRITSCGTSDSSGHLRAFCPASRGVSSFSSKHPSPSPGSSLLCGHPAISAPERHELSSAVSWAGSQTPAPTRPAPWLRGPLSALRGEAAVAMAVSDGRSCGEQGGTQHPVERLVTALAEAEGRGSCGVSWLWGPSPRCSRHSIAPPSSGRGDPHPHPPE